MDALVASEVIEPEYRFADFTPPVITSIRDLVIGVGGLGGKVTGPLVSDEEWDLDGILKDLEKSILNLSRLGGVSARGVNLGQLAPLWTQGKKVYESRFQDPDLMKEFNAIRKELTDAVEELETVLSYTESKTERDEIIRTIRPIKDELDFINEDRDRWASESSSIRKLKSEIKEIMAIPKSKRKTKQVEKLERMEKLLEKAEGIRLGKVSQALARLMRRRNEARTQQ